MLPDQYNPEIDPQELARAAGNMLRAGTVVAVQADPPRVRVKTGGITTDWIPWAESRAGGTAGRTWWPPAIGEQGKIEAPGGDFGRARFVAGTYSDAMPAGEYPLSARVTEWDENNRLHYDQGELEITCVESIALKVGESSLVISKDKIELKAGGAWLALDAGTVQASADVIASGVSLVNHVHIGVMPGPALSGPPLGGAGGGFGGGGDGGDFGNTDGIDGWAAPSDPGTTDDSGEKSIRNVPADATGVYRGAIFTRMEYGQGSSFTPDEIAQLADMGWMQQTIFKA